MTRAEALDELKYINEHLARLGELMATMNLKHLEMVGRRVYLVEVIRGNLPDELS